MNDRNVINDNEKYVDYLTVDHFLSKDESYLITTLNNEDKWICFIPNLKNVLYISEQYGNGNNTGYKIHVVVPKTPEYLDHLCNIIEIFKNYGLYFKIDACLDDEPSGERAFTVYLPHRYQALWFLVFKEINQYLSNKFKDKSYRPLEYFNTFTTKLLNGFQFIGYRNDCGEDNSYSKDDFNEAWEEDHKNPFHPTAVEMFETLYKDDFDLYKKTAHLIFKNFKLNSFFIYLYSNLENQKFINCLEKLVKDGHLCQIISNLTSYDMKIDELLENKYDNFTVAKELAQDTQLFDDIIKKFNNENICPLYHEMKKIIDVSILMDENMTLDDSGRNELLSILNIISAITINTLYTCQNYQLVSQTCVEQISNVINEKLIHNKKYIENEFVKQLTEKLIHINDTTPLLGDGFKKVKGFIDNEIFLFWRSAKNKFKNNPSSSLLHNFIINEKN